jgi:hypothetical protein
MMLVVGSLGRGRAGQALAAAENSVPALGSPMTSLREGCSVLGRLGDGEGGGVLTRSIHRWLISAAAVEAHDKKN